MSKNFIMALSKHRGFNKNLYFLLFYLLFTIKEIKCLQKQLSELGLP